MLNKFNRGSTTHKVSFPLMRPLVTSLLVGLIFSAQSIEAKSRAFDKLLDAVVRIDVSEATFAGGSKRTIRGIGSGVIMTKEGHILTNAHVVSPKAEEISITLANLERVNARLLGWDHWTDLALLQIDLEAVAKRKLKFSVARFGDSCRLSPGQTVYAVGTPNGLSRTVTKGIISNNNRYFEASSQIHGHETGYFNTWLQTDAAINPGNSGGPLVTEEGRVIGINTRGYLGANNLGFAVPSTTAQSVMAALLEKDEIVRSYIGLKFSPLRDLEDFYNLEINTGMLISGVDPGSPADKAGLRPGDIVLALNGEKVDGRFPEQLPPLQNKIAQLPVGSSISLKVKRNGDIVKAEAQTERLESRVGEQWAFEDWGLSVQRVSRAIAREQKLPTDDGVLVIGTQTAFPADEAGLRRGDIILLANREPIQTLDQLKEIYKGYQADPKEVLLEAQRFHQVSFYVLKP